MIIFVGGVLYFIANFVSDCVGRRVVFRVSIALGVFGFVFLVWSPNFVLTISGLVLLALTVDVCNSLAFIYMSEVSPPRLRNVSSLVMLITYIVGEIVGSASALLFMDYRYLSILYFVITIPVFAFYFWLRPTFYHLIRSRNRKTMFTQLKYILRINRVRPEYIKARLNQNRFTFASEASLEKLSATNPGDPTLADNPIQFGSFTRHFSENAHISQSFEEPPNLTYKASKFELTQADLEPLFSAPKQTDANFIPLRTYFGQCVRVVHIVAYTFLVMNLYWVKGMSVFLPEKMGFESVYLNNFLLSLADLLGMSLMICFLNKTRRTTLNRFHLSFILFSSATVMILHNKALQSNLFVKIVDIFLSCKSPNLTKRLCANVQLFCDGIRDKLQQRVVSSLGQRLHAGLGPVFRENAHVRVPVHELPHGPLRFAQIDVLDSL